MTAGSSGLVIAIILIVATLTKCLPAWHGRGHSVSLGLCSQSAFRFNRSNLKWVSWSLDIFEQVMGNTPPPPPFPRPSSPNLGQGRREMVQE